jgi:acyl-CoA thioesterase I
MKILTILVFYSIHFPLFGNTILFLGDSLTEGYGVSREKAYPKVIEKRLVKDGISPLKILNGSISGSTSASAFKRLRFFLRAKPDIIVLALGANDGLRGIKTEVTYKNLEKTISFARKNKIIVLLCGVRVPPNYGPEYNKNFTAIYTRLQKKFDLAFVPRILEGVAGNPKLNQADGIHPNEQGQKILANTVYIKLKDLL